MDVTAQPLSVPVFGQPLVLVRNAGSVWALEDRCPHRGVPLSAGCLTATGLACPYHGWTFDRDGICREMPGWPDASPSDVRIAAFDAIESCGLVWLSTKSSHLRASTLPERVSCLDSQGLRFLHQSVSNLSVIEAQARLLERHGSNAIVTVAGDGFRVDSDDLSAARRRHFGERIWFSGLSVVQWERRYRKGSTACITLGMTPRDEHSTHVFTMAHVQDRWIPRWLLRWRSSRLTRRVRRTGQSTPVRAGSARAYLEAAWTDPPHSP